MAPATGVGACVTPSQYIRYMAQDSSTIRFRLEGVEFELTASPEAVEKAWQALEPAIVGAFTASPSTRQASSNLPRGGSTQRASRRRGGAAPATGGTVQGSNRSRLMEAEMDDVPELGDDPSALVVGLAILRWARDKLGIGELTVQDIHAFAHERLRVPHGANAYREAFRKHGRWVHKSTTAKPQTYKLMVPGERQLEQYLSKLAAGGTAAEAETALAAEAAE